jgi:hypothetical protein
VSLQEWFRDNRRQATIAIVAPFAWLGLEAGFGQVSWPDFLVATVIFLAFAYTARPKPPPDDPQDGIYGS